MITVTFPDGAKRQVEQGVSARDVAASISKSLEKKAVAAVVNGALVDLADPIATDASLRIVTRDDPEALELIRHDCAHVLAEAVQELFPGTQVTIGPVIENGFYYDFFRNEPFTHRGLRRDREEDARDHPARQALHQDRRRRARRRRTSSAPRASSSRSNSSTRSRQGQDIKFYDQGGWIDLCRGPHMTSTGKIGNAFKLMKVAGAYWRGDSKNPMLTRIYGTAWASEKDLQGLSHGAGGSREARPPQARPRDGPVPFPGRRPGRRLLARQGLDDVPAADRLHAPPARQARLSGSERAAAARQVAVGNLRPLGLVQGGHVRRDLGRRDDRGRPGLRHQADELPRPRADLQARASSPIANCRCGLPNSATSTATSRRARCTA